MAGDWNTLAMEYEAHKDTVVVADVDCTGAGRSLCHGDDPRNFKVKGYPTIIAFTPKTTFEETTQNELADRMLHDAHTHYVYEGSRELGHMRRWMRRFVPWTISYDALTAGVPTWQKALALIVISIFGWIFGSVFRLFD